MTRPHDISPEVDTVIREVIGDLLSGYKLETCGIEPGDDVTGDPVVFVDLCYALNETEVDPARIAKVRSALRRRLIDLGEFRFPHIRHRLDDEQRVKA